MEKHSEIPNEFQKFSGGGQKGKAKSVAFTAEGEEKTEALLYKLFGV